MARHLVEVEDLHDIYSGQLMDLEALAAQSHPAAPHVLRYLALVLDVEYNPKLPPQPFLFYLVGSIALPFVWWMGRGLQRDTAELHALTTAELSGRLTLHIAEAAAASTVWAALADRNEDRRRLAVAASESTSRRTIEADETSDAMQLSRPMRNG
jgi:hypothetical protein